MKKIAIITLHAVKNYGSVLQTYATQKIFEDMGYEVSVIDYRRPWETTWGYWFYLPEKNIKNFFRQLVYFPSKIKQKIVFEHFLHCYIHLTNETYCSNKDFIKNPVIADLYCTGSDQVWNSGWNRGLITPYFLSFVPPGKKFKKISYASSFGNENVQQEEVKQIKAFLDDYHYITLREKSSVKLLKEKFNLKSYEVFDPTLQLTGDFWRKFSGKKIISKENYILVIQLNRNSDFDSFSINFAKSKNARLVRLCLRFDQIIQPGKHIFIPNVQEYVKLIDQAKFVLTDSFHAISFCLNLNKQFYCYYPQKNSMRLKNILKLVDLEHRVITNNTLNKKQLENIDYARVMHIIEHKREEYFKVIRKILDD